MPVDPEYLRQHYASLSDESLLEVEREDLVDAARKCYDEEVKRRRLNGLDAESVEEPESDVEPTDLVDIGDWQEDAAEVYSWTAHAENAPAPEAALDAQDALEAAGVPCYLDLFDMREEKSPAPEPTHRWRLMAPHQLNYRAESILQRDIFNDQFEAGWKAQLETLSDAELRAMSPKLAFCGLFDRIERVNKAYDEEVGRRRLKSESA